MGQQLRGITVTLTIASAALVALAAGGCGAEHGAQAAANVAVTSSYLECAARELLGPDAALMRLAEPGMCPGHFDLRPSQVRQLRGCRVLLRFDFQEALDRQLSGAADLVVVSVTVPGGMCQPDSYAAACRRIADALVARGLVDRSPAEDHLAVVDRRMQVARAWAQQMIEDAHLRGRPVLVSEHQAAFVRWLGLGVVATFGGADSTLAGRIDDAIARADQAGCRLVIANRPEGTKLAESLARRLDAAMVVFDNFPAMTEQQSGFDAMFRGNVRRLITAQTEL